MAIKQTSDQGFTVTPILVTDGKKTWNKTGDFDLAVDKVTFDPNTETKGTFPMAVSLTRQLEGKQQKIMVLGDADFMSNNELSRFNLNTVNTPFTTRMFKWFTDGEYPFSVERPAVLDKQIKVSRSQINGQKVVFFAIIPGIILILGATLLIRRRRN